MAVRRRCSEGFKVSRFQRGTQEQNQSEGNAADLDRATIARSPKGGCGPPATKAPELEKTLGHLPKFFLHQIRL
jgi:hypothetical protein